MKNSLQRRSAWHFPHFSTFRRLSLCRVAVGVGVVASSRLTCLNVSKKKRKKGKRGKKLVREGVIQGRLRNGTRRCLFQMDNSAYMPNHLPPPSLVVFSQAGGLPEALRMQRPFNPQVSVLLSLPVCLSLSAVCKCVLLLLLKLCLPAQENLAKIILATISSRH